MKLPAWFRYLWWFLLVVSLTFTLGGRWGAIIAGASRPWDVVPTFILFGLLLGPLFAELTLFGATVKRLTDQMKAELQAEIRNQFLALRLRLRSETPASHRVGFHMGRPVPDAALAELRARIEADLSALIERTGTLPPAQDMDHLRPPDGVILALSSRYQIERELRRIWTSRGLDGQRAHRVPVRRVLSDLIDAEVIPRGIVTSILQVLSVCSSVVHETEPSPERVEFIRTVVPEVVAALKTVA